MTNAACSSPSGTGKSLVYCASPEVCGMRLITENTRSYESRSTTLLYSAERDFMKARTRFVFNGNLYLAKT